MFESFNYYTKKAVLSVNFGRNDYTFFKSVCNKTNQFYQTLNVNKSLSCDVFMTTVATLLFKSVCYTN